MSTKAFLVDPVRGNSTLVRPRYSAGLLLRDDDLTAGVDYTRNLSRLLFRSFFGCGVVCGLKVSVKEGCGGKIIVTIAEGVGLACSGDPIHVPQPVAVTLDPCSGKKIPDKMWVTLCLTDRNCAPRTSMCACDDETSNVSTREIAGYELRVLDQLDDCACGCAERPFDASTKKDEAAAAKGANAKAAGKSVARTQDAATALVSTTPDCACVDPCSPCYREHYAGICGCSCCDSDCVMLAVLTRSTENVNGWKVNHSVRRFIRPVLMRDPQVVIDNEGTLCPVDSAPKAPAKPEIP